MIIRVGEFTNLVELVCSPKCCFGERRGALTNNKGPKQGSRLLTFQFLNEVSKMVARLHLLIEGLDGGLVGLPESKVT